MSSERKSPLRPLFCVAGVCKFRDYRTLASKIENLEWLNTFTGELICTHTWFRRNVGFAAAAPEGCVDSRASVNNAGPSLIAG